MKVSRWTGEFIERAHEEAYLAFRWPQLSRQLRIVAALEGLAYASCSLIDHSTFGFAPPFWILAAMRSATVACCLWLIYLTRGKGFTSTLRAAIALSQTMVLFTELAEYVLLVQSGMPPATVGGATLALMILIFFCLMPNPPQVTLIVCGFGTSLFLLYQARTPAISSGDSLFLALCALAAIAFGYVFTLGRNRLGHSDYSNQRALEREIAERRRAEEAAAEAGRAKERFLAIMSHEMRTPLGGIIGALELVKNEESPQQRAALLEMMSSSALQLRTLVDDVLEFTRSDRRETKPVEESFELSALLLELTALYGLTAVQRGLHLEGPVGLAPRWVRGDRARIRQILANLLDNALKFTSEGGVRLTLNEEERAEHLSLTLGVEDTGIGIAEAQLAQIFEPFFQVDDTLHRSGGAGIGLTVCRELTQALGGELTAESELGVGSRFTLKLSLALSAPPAPEPEEQPPRPRAILLVDDSSIGGSVIRSLLARQGHQVALAASGEEAVALALAHPYELILMDLHLPGIDGLEASRRIAAGLRPPPPIVALTADIVPTQVRACRAAGLHGFLPKPVRSRDLAHLINAIDRHGDAWQLEAPSAPSPSESLLEPSRLEELLELMEAAALEEVLAGSRGAINSALEAMERAGKKGEYAAAAKAAHLLKGVAANLGLSHLRTLAEEVERCARSGHGACEERLAKAREAAAASLEALDQWRAKSAPTKSNDKDLPGASYFPPSRARTAP